MVTKLMPSLFTKNQDLLVLMRNLEDPTFMIGLQIKEKLMPNMPI
jgi:hypothetical protein